MIALIINDCHIGANRMSGTTQETRRQVKEYLRRSLRTTILQHLDKDLVVNGDLFDSFDVELREVFLTFLIFSDWIIKSGHKVILGQGNHDIAKNSEKMSSFSFLCSLLQEAFPGSVVPVTTGLTHIKDNLYMVPHVVNQQAFDDELEKAMNLPSPAIILLHANVDNKFAVEADHSLNVSMEVIDRLLSFGHKLVVGHEHHHRKLRNGRVIVTGNQWPSSVYDCMGTATTQTDGVKYAHLIHHNEIDAIPTWDALGDFENMDWHDLQNTKARFVRVVGKASAEEAADMVSAVAKYRQTSYAWVITNAVEIGQLSMVQDLPSITAERIGKVDVLNSLLEQMEEAEANAIRELLDGEQT